MEHPFLFGAQYYRAPTPARENWESDLKNMKALGFNAVKFWVQWRWAHRSEDEFYFDDIDELMDIAHKNGLRVTLNVIFDVAPLWVTERYPDALIVLANGKKVLPATVGHRQIGGFPGVCYSHREAFEARQRFLRVTVERYRNHPALDMWDVWNEPEQCGTNRAPVTQELSCFCENCRAGFLRWLKEKYGSIDRLNQVWGRCYRDFDEAELPREHGTFGDFLDFREFHLDKMTQEAQARLRLVRSLDPAHPAYLHVVPNTSSIFNSLTGVDDFRLAEDCDVFASTNFAKPIWSILTLSAGRGKICYNAECHIGSGSIRMHQKQIAFSDLTKDLVPQIGMGIRGFLFWQYRPEVLGPEAPAWGAILPDGRPGSVGTAAGEFIAKLRPYLPELLAAKPPEPEIAIWKGRKNEILSFCINEETTTFAQSIEAYVDALYSHNYNCRIVDDQGVLSGLEGVRLLILPQCYELDAGLAAAIDRFAAEGGTVLCEAHLGGYNADTGRHSCTMPGLGLDKAWGIREEYTTSSYHLKLRNRETVNTDGMADDVKKALDVYGVSGGKYFPIRLENGSVAGCQRFAALSGSGCQVLGTFDGVGCILKKKYRKGTIFYCGSDLGQGAAADPEGFAAFLLDVVREAGAADNGLCPPAGVHVDRISERLLAVNNLTETDVLLPAEGRYASVFHPERTGGALCVPTGEADLFVREGFDA